MSSLKSQTISGIKWTAIEKFSVQIVNFTIGLVLARILMPNDFGIIGMLNIFMAISQTFIDSGFSNALIRKKDVAESDYSTAFFFNVVVGILCYSVLFLCSSLIASFFKTPILNEIIKVEALILLINSLTSVQYAKLNHEMNFMVQAKISLTSALFSGLVGIILAKSGFGVWALAWQGVCNAAIRAILLWISSHWAPTLIFSWDSFKYLFGFGSRIMLSGLLHTIYTNFSSLAIGRVYTATDLGNYERGNQFANLPSRSLTSIFQKVTFPLFSTIQDDKEKLIGVYRKYICVTSMIIFFLMSFLAASAKPLILFLLTAKWAKAIIILQISCFAMMFDHICQINLNLLQVTGRSDLFLKLEIIKKSISFAILLAAIPMGVTAICISSVIYTQLAVYINTYYTGKLFGLGYIEQIKDFAKYLIASLISCIPAFCLSFSDIHPLFILSTGGLTAITLYCMFLRKDRYFIECFDILLSLINKRNPNS